MQVGQFYLNGYLGNAKHQQRAQNSFIRLTNLSTKISLSAGTTVDHIDLCKQIKAINTECEAYNNLAKQQKYSGKM